MNRRVFTFFFLFVLALSQFATLEHGLSALVHTHHEDESPAHHESGDTSGEELVSGINVTAIRNLSDMVSSVSAPLAMTIPVTRDHLRQVSSTSGSPLGSSPPFYITHRALLI